MTQNDSFDKRYKMHGKYHFMKRITKFVKAYSHAAIGCDKTHIVGLSCIIIVRQSDPTQDRLESRLPRNNDARFPYLGCVGSI